MEYKDYYKILGLERSATQDDIKRAYHKLARKYHPDVSKEPNAKERFQEIAEAYQALKDPKRRAAYDRLGEHWREGETFRPPPGWDVHYEFRPDDLGEFAASDFSDFFRGLFGRFGFGHGAREAPSVFGARNVHATLPISPEDSYRGNTVRVSVPMHYFDDEGVMRTRTRTVDVKVPKGIVQGQQIRVAGEGAPGAKDEPAGDLYLTVTFTPHRLFEIRGRDVYLTLPVTPWEAALGASVPVPTLGGRVRMKIPPGSQTGKQMRLKGRGLPGSPAGDQYVILKIVTPPAKTEAARELYRHMAEELRYDPRSHMEG